MNKYKKLTLDIIIFSVGIIGAKFILFLLLPLYTNVLLPNEYAIADLIYTSVQLLMPISSLAIYNGELRYGLESGINKNKVIYNTFLMYFCAIFFMLIMVQALKLYSPLSDWRYYIFFYTAALLLYHIMGIYLKINNLNKCYSLASILQAFLIATFNILFLVIYPMKIKGYLLSSILSFIVVALFLLIKYRPVKLFSLKEADMKLLKKMTMFSIPFVFNDISWWFIHATDKYMIAQLLGLPLLGLYATASKIPSLINSIAGIFSQAWTISAIEEYKSTSNTEYFSNILRKYYLFIFGILIISVSIIKIFMKYYVSELYFDSYKFIPILLIAASFGAISSYTISIFSAFEKSNIIMKNTIVAAVANVIFNYIFIKLFTIWGALYATFLSYSILLYLNSVDLGNTVKINLNKNIFLKLTTISIIQAICVTCQIYDIYISIIAVSLYCFIARDELVLIIKKTNHFITKYIKYTRRA